MGLLGFVRIRLGLQRLAPALFFRSGFHRQIFQIFGFCIILGCGTHAFGQGALSGDAWEQATLSKVPEGSEPRKVLTGFMEGLYALDGQRLVGLNKEVTDQILASGWRQEYPDLQAAIQSQIQPLVKIAGAAFHPQFAFPRLEGPAQAPFLKLQSFSKVCCLVAELQLFKGKPAESVRWISVPVIVGSHLVASSVQSTNGGAVGLVMLAQSQSTIHRWVQAGAIPADRQEAVLGSLVKADTMIQSVSFKEPPMELRRKRTLALMRITQASLLRALGRSSQGDQVMDPFTNRALLNNGRTYYSTGPDGDNDGGTKPLPGDLQATSDGDLFPK